MQIQIEVKCNECGQTLDGTMVEGELFIDLCPACAKHIEAKNYEQGYRDGVEAQTIFKGIR